jgi:N-acetylglucosamine malate deacetylase 1
LNVVVVAPHPDDETLGCAGTIMRHIAEGDKVSWLIVTRIFEDSGYPKEKMLKRQEEISLVAEAYGFDMVECLGFPTTKLDTLPMGTLVSSIAEIFHKLLPEMVYCPFAGDVHSDHNIVFKAIESCSKWFRFPSIKKIALFETISETDIAFEVNTERFKPNLFVDISAYLDRKIEIMELYEGESGDFPFPRSEKALRSLAAYRGATSGYEAAESFMLMRERR